MNHKLRKRARSIDHDISTFPEYSVHGNALGPQPGKKAVKMRLSCDNYHCIPDIQSVSDRSTHVIKKAPIIGIKSHDVTMGILLATSDVFCTHRLQRTCGAGEVFIVE